MNFKKLLTGSILVLLLTACGQVNDPSSSSDSIDDNAVPEEVLAQIGTRSALKNVAETQWQTLVPTTFKVNVNNTNPQEISYSVYENGYTINNSTNYSGEVFAYVITEGIFGDKYVSVTDYGVDGAVASRYKIVTQVSEYCPDQITEVAAQEELADAISELDFYDSYYSKSRVNQIINSSMASELSYEITADGGVYTVEGKYLTPSSNTHTYVDEFEFVLENDNGKYLPISSSVSRIEYNKNDINENGEVAAGATPVETFSASLSEVSYAAPSTLDVGTTLDKFFVTSLNGYELTHIAYDEEYNEYYSEEGTLYAGKPLYLPGFETATNVVPSTAVDLDSIYITNVQSTEEDFLTVDEYGDYIVTETVGATATLTFGNSFVNDVFSVEVITVAFDTNSSNLPAPQFNNVAREITDNVTIGVDYSYNPSTLKITGNVGDKAVIRFETDNEGPFDLSGYEIAFMMGNHIAQFAADPSIYYSSPYDSWAVYVEITLCSESYDYLVIAYNGNFIFELATTIVAGSTGGDEGGDEVLPLPQFNYVAREITDNVTIGVDYSYNPSTLEITGNVGDKAVIRFETDNEGPFDLSGYTVGFAAGNHNAQFAADPSVYYETSWDSWAVYVEITVGSLSNDWLVIMDSSESIIFELTTTIITGSTGGDEGGDEVLPLPQFNGSTRCNSTDVSIQMNYMTYKPTAMTISGNIGDKFVIIFDTDNEGPFNLSNYMVGFMNGSHNAQFAADPSIYYETSWDSWAVYVEITLGSLLSDSLIVMDASENVVFNIETTITPKTGGDEGGDEVLPLPQFNGSTRCNSADVSIQMNYMTYKPTAMTISGNAGDKFIIIFDTDNEGPFDLSGHTVGFALGTQNAQFDANQSQYYIDAYDSWAVYVEVTLAANSSEDYLILMDASENVIFEIATTVEVSTPTPSYDALRFGTEYYAITPNWEYTNSLDVSYDSIVGNSYSNVCADIGDIANDHNTFTMTIENTGTTSMNVRVDIKATNIVGNTNVCNQTSTLNGEPTWTDLEWGGTTVTVAAGETVTISITYDCKGAFGPAEQLLVYFDSSQYDDSTTHAGSATISNFKFSTVA